MKKFFSLIVALTIILTLSACYGQKRSTRQTFAFDTVVNITTDKKDESFTDRAFELCRKYEKVFSRTDEESELFLLNSKKAATISPTLEEVISFSLEMSALTDGAFDITISPLTDLWNVNNRTEPPTETQIQDALKKTHLVQKLVRS